MLETGRMDMAGEGGGLTNNDARDRTGTIGQNGRSPTSER